ncbi:hypothetical protein TELCIR_16324, partial [Teladorsagia circumcincta]
MALMAQLYPANLYPTVVQLIAMVDWKASIIEINDHNYRQFLLFRLIFVLLLKCGEHLENRKKSEKESEEKRAGSSGTMLPDIDSGSPSSSMPSGGVEFGADGSREATPISSSEDRTTTKRRSTEKLLGQIVNQLCNAGALEFCRDLLESVASYWRTAREHRTAPRAWSRDCGATSRATGVMDAREHYYTMITDVALRLPCQMRRILSDVKFDERWQRILCEMTLLRILWNDLWPLARGLGDHAAQLADILSTYASRLFSSAEMQAVCDAELEAISATVASCSSVVQPNPGLCEHCGENVFQCVKCRAINYDEKDPFLCQSCGFCKYARMDISLVCRPLPGVQPITTDAERASCVESMARLLCEMEQTRSQLAAGRALSESLWLQSRPLPPISFHVESPDAANALIAALPPINHQQPAIHALLMTTTHCKALHEELCMQTQQLIAFREELRGYDRSVKTAPLLHQAINQGFYNA